MSDTAADLVVRNGDMLAPALEELAAVANREHEAGCRAAETALTHWINAGEALLTAREQVEFGEWKLWVADHFHADHSVATACMRLATYKDAIRAEGITTVNRARLYLRGLPAARGPASTAKHDEVGELRVEAQRLADKGVPGHEIAKLVDKNPGTVWRWLNPEGELRIRRGVWDRQRAKKRAARQAERDRTIRKIGGSVAESYSMVRKTAQALDRACDQASDREVRVALESALAKLHNVEDEIVHALGVA